MWNNLVWLAVRQTSISRSDSRHVSYAKAITRNKSAQPNVRTLASPWWRLMMRPKVFHGTNSITCANSVFPRFMRHPRSFRPVNIANTPGAIQIVDTHEMLEPHITIGVAVDHHQMNRTLLRC
jgi:hypothetical protein